MLRLVLILLVAAAPIPAAAFETSARAAWVYDVTTDTVLFEKDADRALPPASMSKLMTLYMLFDALEAGRVSMADTFAVSTNAKEMGGSTMFLNELDRPTVEELIQGIIVSSGNDATVAVAEGLAGTEAAFARQMNDRAREIGLTNSTFANASGWPHPNQYMSTRDIGVLAVRLIEQFPEYYGYFSQEEFDYENRSPANRFNRNPLLGLDIGADGLKTGHTQEAGYGLVGSAEQGDRRIVFVVTGLDSQRARSQESQQIVGWAFRQFSRETLAERGDRMGSAPVWMGDLTQVDLRVDDPVEVLRPASSREPIEARIEYDGPLEAPVAEGDQVGELVVSTPDMPEKRIALVADRDVPRGGFVPRVRSAAQILLDRAMAEVAGLAS